MKSRKKALNWSISIGWIVFFGVPAALWIFGAFANRAHGFAASALTFVVGSDGRLSVSKPGLAAGQVRDCRWATVVPNPAGSDFLVDPRVVWIYMGAEGEIGQ